MACDVPVVAARVGSMEECFRDKPEWLYEPSSAKDLAGALERRLKDKSTGYYHVVTWSEAAGVLEKILFNVAKDVKSIA
jgi:glycosyltransferase involved in cell wall biosynthesis